MTQTLWSKRITLNCLRITLNCFHSASTDFHLTKFQTVPDLVFGPQSNAVARQGSRSSCQNSTFAKLQKPEQRQNCRKSSPKVYKCRLDKYRTYQRTCNFVDLLAPLPCHSKQVSFFVFFIFVFPLSWIMIQCQRKPDENILSCVAGCRSDRRPSPAKKLSLQNPVLQRCCKAFTCQTCVLMVWKCFKTAWPCSYGQKCLLQKVSECLRMPAFVPFQQLQEKWILDLSGRRQILLRLDNQESFHHSSIK